MTEQRTHEEWAYCMKDLVDVPKAARAELKIVPITHEDQVLEVALSPEVVVEPPRPRRRPEEQEDIEEE